MRDQLIVGSTRPVANMYRYKGYRTTRQVTPDLVDYLEMAYQVLERSLRNYPKVLAIHFSLRFTYARHGKLDQQINQFFKILKTEIQGYISVRRHYDGASPDTSIDFLWLFAYGTDSLCQYEVFLLVNHKVFKSLDECHEKGGSLWLMLQHSWAMALGEGVTLESASKLVYCTRGQGVFVLDNSDNEESIKLRHRFYMKMSCFASSRHTHSGNENQQLGSSVELR